MEPLQISAYTLYITNKCIGLPFATTDIGLSSLKFLWWAPEFLLISFRPFKVIQVDTFAANRKRVCDFLLVRNTNFSPILHRFGDMIGFMCPYSTLILGVFPLHQIDDVGRQRAHGP